MIKETTGAVVLVLVSVFASAAEMETASQMLAALPPFPANIGGTDCDLSGVKQKIQQFGEEDYRQSYMAAMRPPQGAAPITDQQAEAIGILSDPAVNACPMNAQNGLMQLEARETELRERVDALMTQRIEKENACPQVGGFPEQSCLEALQKQFSQLSREEAARYLKEAGMLFSATIDTMQACAQSREAAAERAIAAGLPGSYISLALSLRTDNWGMPAEMAERYERYCQSAIEAAHAFEN